MNNHNQVNAVKIQKQAHSRQYRYSGTDSIRLGLRDEIVTNCEGAIPQTESTDTVVRRTVVLEQSVYLSGVTVLF